MPLLKNVKKRVMNVEDFYGKLEEKPSLPTCSLEDC